MPLGGSCVTAGRFGLCSPTNADVRFRFLGLIPQTQVVANKQPLNSPGECLISHKAIRREFAPGDIPPAGPVGFGVIGICPKGVHPDRQ